MNATHIEWISLPTKIRRLISFSFISLEFLPLGYLSFSLSLCTKELFNCYNLNRQGCYFESQTIDAISKKIQHWGQADRTQHLSNFCFNLGAEYVLLNKVANFYLNPSQGSSIGNISAWRAGQPHFKCKILLCSNYLDRTYFIFTYNHKKHNTISYIDTNCAHRILHMHIT